MTLPASGSSISMSQINTELGRSSTATISLDTAENGGYATINTCASPYPLAANPASMSEWYGYNHTAPCVSYYSNFAMDDGGDATQQNMLYSNNISYSTNTSNSRPDPSSMFTISFWIKRDSNTATQGYLSGIDAGDYSILLYWYTMNIGGDEYSMISLAYSEIGGAYMYSTCVLNDANNKNTTGLNNTDPWGPANQGVVNDFGYSLITIIVDYANWGTADYVNWYWNGDKLDVPWSGSLNPNADALSATYGDSIGTPDWTNGTLFLGGYVPSELSSGCLLDSFAIYLTTAITGPGVGTLFGTVIGGTNTVAPLSDYQSLVTGDDLLYYNFEETGQLGLDTGGYYGQHLDDFNQPIQSSDHA